MMAASYFEVYRYMLSSNSDTLTSEYLDSDGSRQMFRYAATQLGPVRVPFDGRCFLADSFASCVLVTLPE